MKIPEKPKDSSEIMKSVLASKTNLFKLLDDEQTNSFIIKCNQEYIPWDKLRRKETPKGISKEHIWAILKMFRSQQYKLFKFNGWKFRYILLDGAQRKLHLLDKDAAGNLETGLTSINAGDKDRYMISSLMEEAIASSQLEGAATTRKIAKEILRLKRKPRNISEKMILNGYETMQKIVRMKDTKITPEIVLELQSAITKDTLKNKADEGRHRDNNEIVVGDPLDASRIYHIPPDYRQISKLMEEFCRFASDDDGDFIHPIVKGIMLHFLIGYIHPFNDGNGRTARTIFYWYVLTRGYWLFEFMAISRILLQSKTKYGLAYLYTETDENDLTYFINYNLEAMEEALTDMEKYIARKKEEQREAMKLILGIKDINLRQAEILKEFIKEPEKQFIIAEITSKYNVVYQTARNDLLFLVDLGYLEKIKIKNKFVFKLVKKES